MKGEGVRLVKRKCFRIGQGRRIPFLIGAGDLLMGMLKAGFGFQSCPSSTRTVISLSRKGITLGGLLGGRGRTFLLPGREIILGGGGNEVRIRCSAISGTLR